jgi:hypothetical protein
LEEAAKVAARWLTLHGPLPPVGYLEAQRGDSQKIESHDPAYAAVAGPGNGAILIPWPFSTTTVIVRQQVLHSQK